MGKVFRIIMSRKSQRKGSLLDTIVSNAKAQGMGKKSLSYGDEPYALSSKRRKSKPLNYKKTSKKRKHQRKGSKKYIINHSASYCDEEDVLVSTPSDNMYKKKKNKNKEKRKQKKTNY